jgi:hypothetical protein
MRGAGGRSKRTQGPGSGMEITLRCSVHVVLRRRFHSIQFGVSKRPGDYPKQLICDCRPRQRVRLAQLTHGENERRTRSDVQDGGPCIEALGRCPRATTPEPSNWPGTRLCDHAVSLNPVINAKHDWGLPDTVPNNYNNPAIVAGHT